MPTPEGQHCGCADSAASVITQIQNLYARLAQAADYGTLEEYGALLHTDLIWEMPHSPGAAIAQQVRRGREDVLAGARERRTAGIQGPGTATWHVLTNIAVTPGADGAGEAYGVAYWHFYSDVDTTPVLRSTGVYRDRFVHTTDGWVLAHRQIGRG
ncbi:nuclear transport factor 2 family protein [Nocardioides sp.]|uniref:nuclear transport factor 2 family protein n=1 Tax=Nocardioides sp. TaxID=35761 RepID=UPI002604F5D1|nr:nuclear transport factor 2 family protein [Nocardioides sp.]